MESEKVQVMKRPLNALKNVLRNAPQEVVCKTIVSAEKAGGDRVAVPAGRRHGGREVAFERWARERGDKDAPAIGPTRKNDPRSSKHGSQIAT